MKARVLVVPFLAATAWAALSAASVWAHEGEEEVPAIENLANVMALLQVQPDMTDIIEDKLTDALEADEVEGVDLDLAAQAQEAFEAGDAAQALDLLAQATGLTPAAALAAQSDEGARPSEVPIADQLGVPGSVGRPNAAATTTLTLGAIIFIGLGAFLVRRTR